MLRSVFIRWNDELRKIKKQTKWKQEAATLVFGEHNPRCQDPECVRHGSKFGIVKRDSSASEEREREVNRWNC